MFEPDNLRLARQRRQLRRTDLAKRLGISQQLISFYEGGKREPSEERVADMAAELGFPVGFFYDSRFTPILVDGLSFRSLSRMTALQRDAALAVASLGVRFAAWVDENFELAPTNLPDTPASLGGENGPENAAVGLRSLWALGDSPIENLLRLAEYHGVRVLGLDLDCREVDAFSLWHRGTAYVFLSAAKTPERRLFDLAHEIGHLVMHKSPHAAPRGRDGELEADRFASALLMPSQDVLAFAPRFPVLDDIIRTKTRWRVSAAALTFRMRQLRMMSDWHYRSLFIELSQLGTREPNSVPFPHSHVLTTVFDVSRDEGKSRTALADELNLTSGELDSLGRGLVLQALRGEGTPTSDERASLRLVSSV